jgi:cell division protein FtsW
MLIGTLGLLFVVLLPGVGSNVNGSSRWLGVGMFSIQPSEFAKLAMLVFGADLLARRSAWIHDSRVTLRPVMVAFCAMALLIMLQPNLGTTIVIAAITFSILFVAGVPLRPLVGWGAAGTGAACVAAMGQSYRRARILAFLHPWNDPLNTGYQTIQSQVSVASGGWFGVGLGASRAKWGFLPYAHTDFIFAIICEELGLVGALTVVGLFVLVGYLGVRAGLQCTDPFGRLLAIGITTWLCVQAFVNIGAVIGVLPITGVPLPFISFGGSSLLATMAASGILLNVARNGGTAPRRPARV